MRVFVRHSLVLALAFGFACGDSSAPAAMPQTLVSFAGDGQGALTGTSLPSPLVVRVTGSDNQPFRGATVTWTVTSGSATLGTPSATTDSSGQASTTVLLGATGGPVGVQAAVTSLTPVTFTATGCDHPVLALGDSVGGALATTDCHFSGFYTDFFEFSVPASQQGVMFTMRSAAFDTWLELYQATGDFAAFDDDIEQAVNTNSQLKAIVPAGDYLVAPSSYRQDSVGVYSLSALTQPAALAGCEVVWVMRGVAVSDSVTAGDCVDTTGGPHYADVVELYVEAGSVLTVLHQSTAFDAALFLSTLAGAPVASNNDSANAGTTTNAYLVYQVQQAGSYLLFIATDTSGATGPYDLSISTSATLSGSPWPSERPVLRFAPARIPKGLPRRGWAR
jgi:hypothetical protein